MAWVDWVMSHFMVDYAADRGVRRDARRLCIDFMRGLHAAKKVHLKESDHSQGWSVRLIRLGFRSVLRLHW